jgi:hypothetical protein
MTISLVAMPSEIYARIGSFADPEALINMEKAFERDQTEGRLRSLILDMLTTNPDRRGEILARGIVQATRLGYLGLKGDLVVKLLNSTNVTKDDLDIVCKCAGELGDFTLIDQIHRHPAFVNSNYSSFVIEYMLSRQFPDMTAISEQIDRLGIETDQNEMNLKQNEMFCRDFKRGTFWLLGLILINPNGNEILERILDKLIENKDVSTLKNLYNHLVDRMALKFAALVQDKSDSSGLSIQEKKGEIDSHLTAYIKINDPKWNSRIPQTVAAQRTQRCGFLISSALAIIAAVVMSVVNSSIICGAR